MVRQRLVLGVFFAAALAANALAAGGVPKFDVQPGCRSAAERVRSPSYASVCVQDEMRARDQMQKDWRQFAPGERARCVQLSSLGGKPTYTELLTCLEMARDVRTLHKDHPTPSTVGQAMKKQ